MNYISTAEAAKKWNLTSNRVYILAREGKIDGAIQIGSRWLIPQNADKPIDGRTRGGKVKKEKEPSFRYYLYDYKDDKEFDPPLSDEEIQIRKVAKAFHACDFDECDKLLSSIDSNSDNICNRIFTLFSRCMTDVLMGKTQDFIESYEKLNLELQKDFSRKKELSFLPHEIDGALGATEFYINDFKIDKSYAYHETFLPHLTYLSIISFLCANTTFTEAELNAFEISCAYSEQTTFHADTQTIHFYLGLIYGLMGKEREMTSHIRKSLEMGEKYKLYWLPSLVLFYYENITEPVLKTFSEEFYDKIRCFSGEISRRFYAFKNQTSSNNFFNILLSNEYIYVFYAMRGYTRKEVANILGTTESYINYKYNKIYETLNIFSKKELIEYYLQANSNTLLVKKNG